MDINTLCDAIDGTKKLVMINNCFSVKMQSTILAEMCCLSHLSLPLEGFSMVSSPVAPAGFLEIFDNGLDVSSLTVENQVRGVIMCFGYPATDADGEALLDRYKNVKLHLYDGAGNHFVLPACKSFMHLCNPVGNDETMILNRLVVENFGNFTLSVEAMLLTVNKNGMTLALGASPCC